MAKRWNNLEIEMLNKIYPYFSWGAIKLLIPNRDYNAICAKAEKLKIRRTQRGRNTKPTDWTPREITKLKLMFPYRCWQKLLKSFPNKSRIAIKSKANRMGLKRINREPIKQKDKWIKKEINIIKKLYRERPWNEIIKALPNRTKIAIKTKANKLGFKRKIRYMTPRKNYWNKNEIHIIKKYYKKVPLIQLKELLPKRTIIAIIAKGQRIFIPNEWTLYEITGITKIKQMKLRKQLKLNKKQFENKVLKEYNKNWINDIVETYYENKTAKKWLPI